MPAKARVPRQQLRLTCADLLGFHLCGMLFRLDGWWLKYIAVKHLCYLSRLDMDPALYGAGDGVFVGSAAAGGAVLFFFFFSWRCPGVIYPFLILCFCSLNGSLPTNVEIKNNTLFFKGPVTYDLAGTYVCDATNSIGTRTGIVDVNITGRVTAAAAPVLSLANAGMALFNAVPC